MSKNKEQKRKNSLGYSGQVTVKILHGDKVVKVKKVHNKGRDRLFSFISYCLGNNYFEQKAPRFLRTFNVDSALVEDTLPLELTFDNQVSDIVGVSSITYPSNHSVAFTFLIPSSQISNTNSNTTINALALYSVETFGDSSMSDPLAYVYLEGEDIISVSSGSNLIIIWELSLVNVGE